MRVLALIDDLIFRAKLREVAKLKELELAWSVPDSKTELENFKLALVDLNATKFDPFELIGVLNSAGLSDRLVAFFSHVNTDLADRAGSLGVTRIYPRSKFFAVLPELLENCGQI